MTLNVLIIAASDPSGGAGAEADIKVASAHGLNALTAITAVTVQDSTGVRDTRPTPIGAFRQILDLHLADQPIAAVKIGALATRDHLIAVRDFLAALPSSIPSVLDPVLVSTSGSRLLEDGSENDMLDLCGRITLVTPNLAEAEVLAGIPVRDLEAMKAAARKISGRGPAVLVKGGHLKEGSSDVLYNMDGFTLFKNTLRPREYHGTGCALASAIAANLALGAQVEPAVEKARGYLRRCIEGARPGKAEAWLLAFPLAD